jgi:hypothetical protein
MPFLTTHGGGRLSRRCVRNRKAGGLFQPVAVCTRSWLVGHRQADV